MTVIGSSPIQWRARFALRTFSLCISMMNGSAFGRWFNTHLLIGTPIILGICAVLTWMDTTLDDHFGSWGMAHSPSEAGLETIR